MLETLSDPETYRGLGLWFLLVMGAGVVLTAFIPPLPAEALVIGAGSMAVEETFTLWSVLAITFVCCLIGDLGVYLTFRRQLIRVLHRWRWGRGLHRRVLRVSIRAGGATTWTSLLLIRAIPGGRAASMATAGLMRLTWGRLIPLALAGALTWTLWLVGLGYITGTTTGLPPWASTVAGIVVGTLVGLIIAVLLSRRRRRS